MKKLIIAACALVFVAGTTQVLATSDAQPETTVEELVKVKRGSFKDTWIHPDVDFSSYNKIVLTDGKFEFRDVGPAQRSRTTMLRSNQRQFGISEADRARFADVVSESFVKQLARSKRFEITEQPGPNTLILRTQVVDVVSSVPPTLMGSGNVYGNTVGEATLMLELIDAETGQTVAFATERRRIERMGGNSIDTMFELNSVTAWAEVGRWASRAGSKLVKELDRMHKI